MLEAGVHVDLQENDAVDLSDLKANPKVGAILFSGYSGQVGGGAMADVLFGAHNPSGRLSQTFYSNSFTTEVEQTYMSMRPNAATGNPGRGYRFYTGTPVYEFGYGTSFTTFNYSLQVRGNPLVDLRHVRPKEVAKAKGRDGATRTRRADCNLALELTVKNNGENNRDADHSVLQFLSPPGAGSQGRPIKYLIHFDSVHLLAGAEETLGVCLTADQFLLADENGDWEIISGQWKLTIGDIVQYLDVQGPGTE